MASNSAAIESRAASLARRPFTCGGGAGLRVAGSLCGGLVAQAPFRALSARARRAIALLGTSWECVCDGVLAPPLSHTQPRRPCERVREDGCWRGRRGGRARRSGVREVTSFLPFASLYGEDGTAVALSEAPTALPSEGATTPNARRAERRRFSPGRAREMRVRVVRKEECECVPPQERAATLSTTHRAPTARANNTTLRDAPRPRAHALRAPRARARRGLRPISHGGRWDLSALLRGAVSRRLPMPRWLSWSNPRARRTCARTPRLRAQPRAVERLERGRVVERAGGALALELLCELGGARGWSCVRGVGGCASGMGGGSDGHALVCRDADPAR